MSYCRHSVWKYECDNVGSQDRRAEVECCDHPVAGAATFYLSVSPQIIYICFAHIVHCTLRYGAITGWVIRFIF